MKLNYQQEVLTLPGSVLSYSDADATQLRVLLWLASDMGLAEKPKQLAKLADCSAREATAAVQYWLSRGVLTADTNEAIPTMATVATEVAPPKKKHLQRADELPLYTTVELAELLENRASMRVLVDEAQNILGKMLTHAELNILIGLTDYLGMAEESVLMLLAHCKKMGKTNLRSIEKYAIRLADEGITDPTALENEIRTAEAVHSFEGEVRALFGMKSRALTSRESKMLRAWVQFGYDIEVVRRAYELTVNATNEPSPAYANAILERWHADGLHTLSEIDASIEAQRNKKEGKGNKKDATTTLGNSFDTDDFFEAALRRSFSD